MLSFALIVTLVSAAIILGTALYLRSSIRSSVGSERDNMIKKIREAEGKLKELLKYSDGYASKMQYETLTQMLEQIKTELELEKNAVQEIEKKLDKAQEDVEQKEGQQQELKTAREEDERRLQELMANFSSISDESRQLERKLADSLKELDRMLEELELTPDQRDVLDQLSRALSIAGGLLRDLITEHAALHERLEQLQQQHKDLEDEYTKLVEQQLGE